METKQNRPKCITVPTEKPPTLFEIICCCQGGTEDDDFVLEDFRRLCLEPNCHIQSVQPIKIVSNKSVKISFENYKEISSKRENLSESNLSKALERENQYHLWVIGYDT